MCKYRLTKQLAWLWTSAKSWGSHLAVWLLNKCIRKLNMNCNLFLVPHTRSIQLGPQLWMEIKFWFWSWSIYIFFYKGFNSYAFTVYSPTSLWMKTALCCCYSQWTVSELRWFVAWQIISRKSQNLRECFCFFLNISWLLSFRPEAVFIYLLSFRQDISVIRLRSQTI